MREPLSAWLPRWFVVAAAVCWLGASPASAQAPTTAKEFHRQGYERAQRKDYAGAIAAFKQANKLEPSPSLICNIGYAYQKWERLPQAQLFLSRCQAPASRREFFEQRLAEVVSGLASGSFARIDVSASPVGALIQVAGFAPDETFAAPRSIWLAFGEHELIARKAGHVRVARRLSIAGSTPHKVDFELRPVVATKPARRLPELAKPRPVSTTTPRARRLPWIATTAGLTLLVAGGGTHWWATGARNDAATVMPTPPGTPNPAFDDALATFRTRRLLALGLYTGGAIALAAGIYLQLVKPSRRATERHSLTVLPFATGTTAGAALQWVH